MNSIKINHNIVTDRQEIIDVELLFFFFVCARTQFSESAHSVNQSMMKKSA